MKTTWEQGALDEALDRAVRWVWSKQRPDGAWNSVADLGPSCTAQVVVALSWCGVLTDDERREALRYLRASQQPDGSFLPYPYARGGTAAATASVWAAMVACGVSRRDEALLRAQQYVHAHGGLAPVVDALLGGELAALLLALVGELPATTVPEVPLGWALVDPLVDAMHRVVHGGVPFGALQLGVLAKALRGRWGADHARRDAGDARAVERLGAWVDTWQNRDGSVNANTAQTALTLLALRATGAGPGDRRFDLAARSLRSLAQRDARGLWFGAFESDVWTTALHLRAVLAAGADPRDPRAVRALEYLLRCQSETPQPRVNNRRPDAVRTGGWAFQRENVSMVDNDDTGMVLAVLGEWRALDRGDDLLRDAVDRAVARGAAFVRSMQNADGGFSAFVCGLPARRPGPVMERPVARPTSLAGWMRFVKDPPASLGDPSTEDVTARVLLGLGRTGVGRDDPAARAALAFLQRFQQERGSWWGRWVVNYLPATAYVLCGAAALGVGRDSAWVERAVAWVLSLQNDDGGWGEWVDSYVDASRAGMAASTPPLTALVLSALVEQGLCEDPARVAAVDRAARYLAQTQRPEGGWSNDDYLAVFVPPDAFYEYPGANDYAPLDALARYRRRRAAVSVTAQGEAPAVDVLEARFEAWSGAGDPRADEAAAALDADRQWGALFGALARGVELPTLAAPVQEVREHATALPAWVDVGRLRAGQGVFARHSWAMGNAFFFASMPASYAAAKGAEVLVRSGPLATDARRRLLDTGHFMWTVMTPGAFEPGGPGFAEVLRVRLVHARVRRALRGEGWGPERGDPIDQASMLGTVLALSLSALRGLEALGVDVAPAEAEDLLYAWSVVGALSGVDDALRPRSLAEAVARGRILQQRAWAPTEAGRRLTAELIESVRAYLPLRSLDDWPVDMIRALSGDEVSALLGVPEGGGTRSLVRRATAMRRQDGARWSGLDGVVHGVTLGVIEAQRLPQVVGAALARALTARSLAPRRPEASDAR